MLYVYFGQRKNDTSSRKWWKYYLCFQENYDVEGEKIQQNVIAIIDSGIDISCNEIANSVYINQDEIPNNEGNDIFITKVKWEE